MVKKRESERPNINRIKEEWEKILKGLKLELRVNLGLFLILCLGKKSPLLKDQAEGQVKRSDENIASAIRNIKISDQESGNLILEFILNFFDFIYFLGLFQLNSTFGGDKSGVWSLIEFKD